MCNCTGEITYSPELFNGYVYKVPEAEQSYKVMSNGMWKCGTDQSGVQYKVDPAPWRVKHRFCTPHGIQEILRPYGAEHLHKKECSENVNFDFESKGVRRLKSIYVYTPRALVTVEDEDSFGNRTKHIRCAYEDGVPQVSSEFNFGGGPYRGGAVWDAEIVALAWGKDPLRDCWVRTQSQSQSVHGGFCGLSNDDPRNVPGESEGRHALHEHFVLLLHHFQCVAVHHCGLHFLEPDPERSKKGSQASPESN